jgi:hypothetical protein
MAGSFVGRLQRSFFNATSWAIRWSCIARSARAASRCSKASISTRCSLIDGDAPGQLQLAAAHQPHEAAQVAGGAVEPAVVGQRLHQALWKSWLTR